MAPKKFTLVSNLVQKLMDPFVVFQKTANRCRTDEIEEAKSLSGRDRAQQHERPERTEEIEKEKKKVTGPAS